MNIGNAPFAQLMDFLPWKTLHRIVDRCGGRGHVQTDDGFQFLDELGIARSTTLGRKP